MADVEKINNLINTVHLNEHYFRMSSWISAPEDFDGDEDEGTELQSGDFVEISCGFALCLAGWQMINDGYKILWHEDSRDFGFYKDGHIVRNDNYVGEVAAESLGIPTPKETGDNHVFMMTNWPTDNVLQAMKYLAEGYEMDEAIDEALPSREQWTEWENRER